MDRTKNTDYKIVITAFFIAAVLLLALLGLPASSAVWLLPLAVLALPLIFAYAVAGGFAAGATAAVLCFAMGCLLDYKIAAMLAAICLPFAFVTGYVIRKKVRFRHGVMAASGAALAGAALAVALLWLLTGERPVDYIIKDMGISFSALDDGSLNAYYQMFRYPDLVTGAVTQAALDATARADALAYILNQFKEALNMSLVSMIGQYALLMGLVGYLIPRAVLKRQGADVITIPAFSEYALPNRFWLAFIVSYLVAVIGEGLGWQGFDILDVTVYSLYGLVLTVQGLAFLDFLYKKRKMSTAARVGLHILALLISSITALVGSLLLWVGLFENMANMRKRMGTKDGAVL